MSKLASFKILIAAILCLQIWSESQAAEPMIAADLDGKTVPSNLPPGKKWKLAWSDEFDGTQLDRTKWDYRLHIMQTRHETWTDQGVTLDGRGHLLFKLYEKDGNYYSSQLQTSANFMDRPWGTRPAKGLRWPIGKLEPAKFLHKYGYYETRCMLSKQPGVVVGVLAAVADHRIESGPQVVRRRNRHHGEFPA